MSSVSGVDLLQAQKWVRTPKEDSGSGYNGAPGIRANTCREHSKVGHQLEAWDDILRDLDIPQ